MNKHIEMNARLQEAPLMLLEEIHDIIIVQSKVKNNAIHATTVSLMGHVYQQRTIEKKYSRRATRH